MKQRLLNRKNIKAMLAYVASLMLTGISPIVCESVIDEFYSSLTRSVEKMTI